MFGLSDITRSWFTRSTRPLSRRPRRQKHARTAGWAGLEALEGRTLLSGFALADVSGTWALASPYSVGTVTMDDASAGVSVNLMDSDGSPTTGSGTYSVTADGAFHVQVGTYDATGAVAAGRDVLAMNYTTLPDPGGNTDAGMAVMVEHSLGNFTPADAKGTWQFAGNGVHGTITLDGNGNVTKGSFASTDTPHGKVTSGTYTVLSDGTFSLNLHTNEAQQPDPMIGTLDNSKDFGALTHTNVGNPPTDDAGLIVMAKGAGKFSKADAAGHWTLSGGNIKGSDIILDGKGKIVGGTVTDSEGNVVSLSGTYAITAAGAVTLNITATDASHVQSRVKFVGGYNGSKDVMVAGDANGNADGEAFVLIRSVPLQPTIQGVSVSANPVVKSPSVSVMVTASNVTVNTPGTISKVSFYWDKDGSGTFTTGDKLIGNGKRVTNTDNWAYSFKTKILTVGTVHIIAVAQDGFKHVSDFVGADLTVTAV